MTKTQEVPRKLSSNLFVICFLGVDDYDVDYVDDDDDIVLLSVAGFE